MSRQHCFQQVEEKGEVVRSFEAYASIRKGPSAVIEDNHETPWGFTQILEHIDVAILVLDLKHQLVDYCNCLFVQLLQVDGRTLDFQELCELLLAPVEEDASFILSGKVSHRITFQKRLLGYSVYNIANRYRCIFLRDITEKNRLESIAQAANAMDNIGFIFSGIRHEIGNPLNSLKMALSVLKSNLDQFPAETIDDYVDRGLADIGRMEYLLKSLKTFSLHEHADFKEQSLAEFMDKFLPLIERDFQARGIGIQIEGEVDDILVRIDKRALHQALLNIFNNAADALAERVGAQISIDTEKRGDLLWLTVSDNGCGIPSEQQKHLFQPFNTSKPHGNGLGLVITRKLLAMMNSDIEICSAPNKGTKVTIRLPISEAPSAKLAMLEKSEARPAQ